MPVNELIEALLGWLLTVVGFVTFSVGIRRRPAHRLVFLFGLSAAIYGIRLLAQSDIIREASGIEPQVWDAIRAVMLYSILAPLVMFFEALLGPGPGLVLRRLWQIDIVYAVGCIAADWWNAQPASAEWLNPYAVMLNAAIVLALAIRRVAKLYRGAGRGGTLSPATKATMVAVPLFIVLATWETLTYHSPLGPGTTLEPIATTLVCASLGWLVVERVRNDQQRLYGILQELSTARAIQRSILPAAVPQLEGGEIAARYRPVAEVAGDFYDFLVVGPESVGVLVADVSGHGIPAALVASMVKVAFSAHADRVGEPGRLLEEMNRTLVGKFELAYVTAAYAMVDTAARLVRVASAGHPLPLLRRPDGSVTAVGSSGLVLGFLPDVQYETSVHPFEPGALLLLYTDGLSEVGYTAGEMFGDRALRDTLLEGAVAAPVLADRLLAACDNWRAHAMEPIADDATVVVVASVARGREDSAGLQKWLT